MEPCAFNAMMEQYEKLVYTVCLRFVTTSTSRRTSPRKRSSAGAPQRLPGRRAEGLGLCRIAANKERPFEKRPARRTQLTDFAAEGTACTAPARTAPLRRRQSCALPRAPRRRRYALCPSRTRPSAYCISQAARWMTSPVRWAARPKQCIRSFTAPLRLPRTVGRLLA